MRGSSGAAQRLDKACASLFPCLLRNPTTRLAPSAPHAAITGKSAASIYFTTPSRSLFRPTCQALPLALQAPPLLAAPRLVPVPCWTCFSTAYICGAIATRTMDFLSQGLISDDTFGVNIYKRCLRENAHQGRPLRRRGRPLRRRCQRRDVFLHRGAPISPDQPGALRRLNIRCLQQSNHQLIHLTQAQPRLETHRSSRKPTQLHSRASRTSPSSQSRRRSPLSATRKMQTSSSSWAS